MKRLGFLTLTLALLCITSFAAAAAAEQQTYQTLEEQCAADARLGADDNACMDAHGQPSVQQQSDDDPLWSSVWNSPQTRRQILPGVRVWTYPEGPAVVMDVPVAWVGSLETVGQACGTTTACGCANMITHRIVAYGGSGGLEKWFECSWLGNTLVNREFFIGAPQDIRNEQRFELAHELWHLKGYTIYIPNGHWPARGSVPAPLRMPTYADIYGTKLTASSPSIIPRHLSEAWEGRAYRADGDYEIVGTFPTLADCVQFVRATTPQRPRGVTVKCAR